MGRAIDWREQEVRCEKMCFNGMQEFRWEATKIHRKKRKGFKSKSPLRLFRFKRLRFLK